MVPRFLFSFPKDPNADTEWNDILRRKGILPPKEEPKEEEEEEQVLKQQSIGKTVCFVSLWLSVLPKCCSVVRSLRSLGQPAGVSWHAMNQRRRTEIAELTMKLPH